MPTLTGIDHVHIYVPDRARAQLWFADVLGFTVEESLREWATPTGPLTLRDASGEVHVAIFERQNASPSSALALRADSSNFLHWKQQLEGRGILDRCVDHDLAWSVYFRDPFGNTYEITTYEHQAVTEALRAE